MRTPTVDLAKTPSFRLDGKRALVTGGGRGIGLAAASALAQAGAEVTLVARTRAEIEAAAQAIIARGDKAAALALDVTDLDAVRGAIAAAEPFDVLVNNAGTNRPAYLMDVKAEDFDAIFALKRISFDVSNYKLSTLDIPVIVGLPLMKSGASTVRVIGGITPIFLFQAKESTTGNPPIGVKDAFETASLEAFIGGQVDWNRWIFEGRYNFGLTEVYTEKVPGFDSRYRGFDISVGYRIR